MDDIPIDPALLAESSQQGAAREYIPPTDEVNDDPLVELNAGMPEADDGDSSGFDDDSDDAYVDSEEEEGGAGKKRRAAKPLERKEDDAVFSRLAGVVGKAGEQGRINVREMNLEAEIARVDREDVGDKRPPLRKTVRKTRAQHKPSYEVSQLLGRANMAYVQGDTAQTITLFTEVIRHDPYVISAWNTLSTVLDQEGDEDGARTMKFFAAHVDDEADTWKDLAKAFRRRGHIQQCVYCLRKALRLDSGDLGVLLELAAIYRLTKNPSKAVDAFKKILKLNAPSARDFLFLSTFHEIILAGNHLRLAANSYRAAFDWHVAKTKPDAPDSTMALEHIITLTDDLTALEQLEEAVLVVRRGQRWLQGRKREKRWDAVDDDREYDPPDFIREDPEDAEGAAEKEGGAGGKQADKDAPDVGQHPLEIPLRHRLAVLRLRLGDDNEAMIHIDELLGLDVEQYHELFLDLGKLLLKREMWGKALDCLAVIQECAQLEDTPSLIFDLAICHQEMGNKKQALEALEWVVENDPNNLDAKYRMAQVLEQSGQKDQALELITQFIQAKANTNIAPQPRSRSVAQPRKRQAIAERDAERKLTKAVLADQMKQKMQALWDEVRMAEEAIGEGADGALERFIMAAGTMVENFRLARSNFDKNRGVIRVLKEGPGKKHDLTSQALALQDRLERIMAVEEDEEPPEADKTSKYITLRISEFYGLNCEEWLNLVIKYCAVLMVKNEEDVAMDILEHVVHAGLFNNRRSEIALRMTIISCAMRVRAFDKVVENCKRLAQIHQFRMEPFLLLLGALSGGGAKAATALQNHQLQKFLHRELVIHDDLVRGHKATYNRERARWNPVTRIGVSRRLGDEVPEPYMADEDGESGGRGGDYGEIGGEEDEADDYEQYGYADADGQGGGEGEMVEYETPRPVRASPTLNILYGQYMLSTRAYQSALFYLFRGYEHVQQDPLLCLMIAQAYLGRAMTRQSDNRNFQISQGLAFLTKYRKYSRKDELSQEEVEFNYGRAFHGIGVPHLAIKHYEFVLQSIQRRMNEAGPEYGDQIRNESLAYEVAHNLMQLYAAVGNMELVKQKSAWLAI